jgi:uncharacterized protein (DUF924 family)
MTDQGSEEVVEFWRNAGPEKWFAKDDNFDAEFRKRFQTQHEQAAAGALDSWLEDPYSALALILLLDQFPRNCFRGTQRVYTTDPLARKAARAAVDAGHDLQIEEPMRIFMYLPFAHSENMEDQRVSVEKARPLGPEVMKHAQGHHDIVERFGRFPHRNAIFDRQTTPEEQKFLDDGGFKG